MTDAAENTGNYAAPPRTFTEAIRICLHKYFDFSGRASRSEFWWFVLFIVLCGLASTLLSGVILGLTFGLLYLGHLFSAIVGIISVLVWVPMVTVGARRLHDTGRSEWRLLLLVPFSMTLYLVGFGLVLIGLVFFSGAMIFMGVAQGFSMDDLTDIIGDGNGPALFSFVSLLGMTILSSAVMVCHPILMYWWAQKGTAYRNQYDHSKQSTYPIVVISMLVGWPLMLFPLHILTMGGLVFFFPVI